VEICDVLIALYVILVIALPAAVGAQLVAKNINRADPTAGFMLLLLAAVPAAAYGFFVPQGVIVDFQFGLGGPGAYGLGVLVGAAIGTVQRGMPRRA
jgi:ABC-type phosphate transport system permease subunit